MRSTKVGGHVIWIREGIARRKFMRSNASATRALLQLPRAADDIVNA